MRRLHPELLKHQRNGTVHRGVRDARASPGVASSAMPVRRAAASRRRRPTSASAATASAVKVDCFECHASRPGQAMGCIRSSIRFMPAPARRVWRRSGATWPPAGWHCDDDDENRQTRSPTPLPPAGAGFSASPRARPACCSRRASSSSRSRAPRPAKPAAAPTRRALGHADRHDPPCDSGCSDCVTACNAENGLDPRPTPTSAQWIRKVEISPSARPRRVGAGDVPALRRAAVRRRVPDRGVVQARRRHRPRRPAHLHRLPLLHDGLPLQGALVRPRAACRAEARRAARQGVRRGLHAVRATHRPWRADDRLRRGLHEAGHGAIVFGNLNDPDSEIRAACARSAQVPLRADLALDPGVRYHGI